MCASLLQLRRRPLVETRPGIPDDLRLRVWPGLRWAAAGAWSCEELHWPRGPFRLPGGSRQPSFDSSDRRELQCAGNEQEVEGDQEDLHWLKRRLGGVGEQTEAQLRFPGSVCRAPRLSKQRGPSTPLPSKAPGGGPGSGIDRRWCRWMTDRVRTKVRPGSAARLGGDFTVTAG